MYAAIKGKEQVVCKGIAHDGEHEAIVDEGLWQQVQERLQAKAPPRKRTKNDAQSALLRGLLTDPFGRPMVPTYATKGSRRYAYYESRKDLVGPDGPRALRLGQGQLERHLIVHLTELLLDEHALRRISKIGDAGLLRSMFETARTLAKRLAFGGPREAVLRSLIASLEFRADRIAIKLKAGPFGIPPGEAWCWTIPMPARKPFREAKLRIDPDADHSKVAHDLISLLAEAMEAQRLIMASPELSLNQLAKREGRCRTHLARLLRISWLSPRIIEAITAGTAPAQLKRKTLLSASIPLEWEKQERQFGIAA